MKPSLILMLGSVALLSACGRDAGPRPPHQMEIRSSVLIPFAVGKAWTYTYTTYDSLGRNDEAQDLSRRHAANRMTGAPHLVLVSHRVDDVALEGRLDAIKTDAVMSAAHEGDIFRMRPAQRHGRTRGPPAPHSLRRQICGVLPGAGRKWFAFVMARPYLAPVLVARVTTVQFVSVKYRAASARTWSPR